MNLIKNRSRNKITINQKYKPIKLNKIKSVFLLLFVCSLYLQASPKFSVAGFYPLENTEREVHSMNPAWRFHKGDVANASDKNFDDSQWAVVSLPHGIEEVPVEASGSVNYQGGIHVPASSELVIETVAPDCSMIFSEEEMAAQQRNESDQQQASSSSSDCEKELQKVKHELNKIKLQEVSRQQEDFGEK